MGFTLFALGNCTTDVIGSGIRACADGAFGDLRGFDLYEKGVGYDIVDGVSTLDEASYDALVKSLKMFPYDNIFNFEQQTPENERATSSIGVLSTIRLGKPQYSTSFDRGLCTHKSLFNKRGKGRWDLGLKFESHYVLFTNIQKSKLTGADMGLFDPDTLMFQQGTDPQMSRVLMQLLDAVQFNERMIAIPYAQLGFSPLDKKGVIDVVVTVDPVIDGATEIVFQVASACNNDDLITSLDEITNYVVTVDGVNNPVTAVTYSNSTGKYTATVTTLNEGDVVIIKLRDGSDDVAEDSLGNLFKGEATFTVAEAPSV